MSIIINDFTLPFEPHIGVAKLQKATDEFGVFIDLDRVMEYRIYHMFEAKKLARPLCNMLGTIDISDKNVISTLMEVMNVPSYKFEVKYSKKGDLSIKKEIRLVLMEDMNISEDARVLVKLYHEYSEQMYLYSYYNQYASLPLCARPSYDGHRMGLANPTWKLLNTSRVSASDPSIQNIKRGCGDIITYPEGYDLKKADSSQVEPRITYSRYIPDELIKNMILAYDDAYAGIGHFALLTNEEDRMLRNDFSLFKPWDLKDFKETRNESKTLVLSANYGADSLKCDHKLAQAYKSRVVNHPKRLILLDSIKQQVDRGDNTFYGAFGAPVTPQGKQKYEEGTQAHINHIERCGLNNPIQTTASELMWFSVAKAMIILKDFPKSHVAFYKHDEGAFYIHQDDKNDLSPLLEDITSYQVKDWINIPCDSHWGRDINKEVPTLV